MRDVRHHPPCAGCADADSRRGFLKQAAALLSGALVVAAGSPIAASGGELTFPIPAADGATVDRDNGVILVRYQGRVFAFNLSCPHENAAVRWKPAVNRFECSRHDSRYEPNGTYTSGRATRNMDRFAVRRAGDTVVVDVARLIQSDTNRAEWEAAAVLL
ncbi:MAG: Rieske 2Fe-2S domain-containing protein [Vicinamibacterales bacterium]|jgi:nitrite reductase/ring-hydroxylating ferredoxin subunit|nr:Rieske 2Fe-2S domain-containing protein [Vicinamibacterales bacterium]